MISENYLSEQKQHHWLSFGLFYTVLWACFNSLTEFPNKEFKNVSASLRGKAGIWTEVENNCASQGSLE